jgi:alpha-glucosidase
LLGEYTGDAALEIQGDGWQGAMTYSNFTKPLWRWMANPKHKGFITYMGIGSRTLNAKQFVETHTKFAAGFPWHVRLNNMNPLDTHDIPRFKTFTIKGAQAVGAGMQFTFPGIPVIWAGDEFGLDGQSGENSRTPLPWNNERPHDTKMIETYAALAKLRKENSALVDGGLRFIYASDEVVVYARENSKQTLLMIASRGKDKKVSFARDAIVGLEGAERIYGSGKLKFDKKSVHFSAEKVSFTVFRLPASR